MAKEYPPDLVNAIQIVGQRVHPELWPMSDDVFEKFLDAVVPKVLTLDRVLYSLTGGLGPKAVFLLGVLSQRIEDHHHSDRQLAQMGSASSSAEESKEETPLPTAREAVLAQLAAMTPLQREILIMTYREKYCLHCGEEHSFNCPCQCENDE